MWDISVVPTGYVKSNGLSGVACTNSAYRFKQTGNPLSLTCQIPNDARHFQTRSDSWRGSLQEIIHTIRTLSPLRRNPLRPALSGDNVTQPGYKVRLWGNSTPKAKVIHCYPTKANPFLRPMISDLPTELQQAAANHLADKDDFAVRKLVEALGPFSRRNMAHCRATWLCILAIKRLLTSRTLPFDPHASDDHSTIATVQKWITDGIAPTPTNWDRICNRPDAVHHVGELANDADTIANAVCSLARFSLHCGVWDAVEAIELTWLYESECPPGYSAVLDFSPWLINIALPSAYNLQDVPAEQLHPLRQP